MAENTTVREDHSNSEEDWDDNIEQQTTEQQQTAQEQATHQQAQVQTTLSDNDDESEYNITAAGGAIRKTKTKANANKSTEDEAEIQEEGGIMAADETQHDTGGHGPKSNLYRERDYTTADEYNIPGNIILQQIENQALITAEEKDQFNTTTSHLSQEEFVHLCDKTPVSYTHLTLPTIYSV